jgi:NAD+ kinase
MLLVVHTGRPAARRTGRAVAEMLLVAGIALRVLEPEAAELGYPRAAVVPASPAAAAGTEMVVVIGGDGTLLRAAELARGAGVPLFGVNLGHVGFLAEAEPEDLADAIAQIVAGDYSVQERMTVDVAVRVNGTVLERTWALNEATVEKAARERMLGVVIEVDGRPLSRFGCDGVVFATPTGSTAYAFSAGGPVVWPEVEAVLMVPICAHALFAGPMVVSPQSVLAAELVSTELTRPDLAGSQPDDNGTNGTGTGGTGLTGPGAAGLGAAGSAQAGAGAAGPGAAGSAQAGAGGQSEVSGAVLWCDGRRMVELPPGARVEVARGTTPVLLARLRAGAGRPGAGPVGAPFTDRLVEKFGLPVAGWRGRGPASRAGAARGTAHREAGPAPEIAVSPGTTGRPEDEEPGGHA